MTDARRQGASVYLNRHYALAATIATLAAAGLLPWLGGSASVAFLIACALSGATGYLGLGLATHAKARLSAIASPAQVPLGGAGVGLLTAALATSGVTGCILALPSNDPTVTETWQPLMGFALGATAMALFAQLGGGLFVAGARLAGARVAGHGYTFRYPMALAVSVGEEVAACLGMTAELFATQTLVLVAALLLTLRLGDGVGAGVGAGVYPLALAGLAVLVQAIALARLPMDNIARLPAQAGGLLALAWLPLTVLIRPAAGLGASLALYLTALVGLGLVGVLAIIADYQADPRQAPVRRLARAAGFGRADRLVASLGESLAATAAPVIALCLALLLAYWLGGAQGIAIAATAAVSLTSLSAALALLPAARGDRILRAIAQEHAIAAAGLVALASFAAYLHLLGDRPPASGLNLPLALAGLLLGGLLPYLFAAMILAAVGRLASSLPASPPSDLTANDAEARGVDPLAREALREAPALALLPILAPLVVGLVLGREALAGLLLGATASGSILALALHAIADVRPPARGAAILGAIRQDTLAPAITTALNCLAMVTLASAPWV